MAAAATPATTPAPLKNGAKYHPTTGAQIRWVSESQQIAVTPGGQWLDVRGQQYVAKNHVPDFDDNTGANAPAPGNPPKPVGWAAYPKWAQWLLLAGLLLVPILVIALYMGYGSSIASFLRAARDFFVLPSKEVVAIVLAVVVFLIVQGRNGEGPSID